MSWEWKDVEEHRRLVAQVTFEDANRPAYGARAWRVGLIYIHQDNWLCSWAVSEYEPHRNPNVYEYDPNDDTEMLAYGFSDMADGVEGLQELCEEAYAKVLEKKGPLHGAEQEVVDDDHATEEWLERRQAKIHAEYAELSPEQQAQVKKRIEAHNDRKPA